MKMYSSIGKPNNEQFFKVKKVHVDVNRITFRLTLH